MKDQLHNIIEEESPPKRLQRINASSNEIKNKKSPAISGYYVY